MFPWLLPCVGVVLLGDVSAFAPGGGLARVSPTTHLSSMTTMDEGVRDFEDWFSSNSSSGAKSSNLQHALFQSTGRGLQFTSTKSSALSKVAVVPRKLVLNVPYSDEGDSSWDTTLSCKLWEECQKGKDSLFYGYCSLLTRGQSLQPGAAMYPSTAPDSLRHWSASQKSLLEESEKGRKLIQVESEQREEWRQKYNSLSDNEKGMMTYEQFEWAMEAVHSRAFRGDFGALNAGEGSPFRKLASLLLPFSALAFGLVAITSPSSYVVEQYFLPLAIVAAAPVILTTIADQKGSNEAVMLPLIDSANHLQEADSVIEYDPVIDSFTLSLGRKCLVEEVDEIGRRAQVCISYGVRKDSELLLNYGFLRGVTIDGLKDIVGDEDRDEIRRRLAEQFLIRIP